MKKTQVIDAPREASEREKCKSVVMMAKLGHGPRITAKTLGIDEAEVISYLLSYANSAYRRGLERGKQSAMPNLPQAA